MEKKQVLPHWFNGETYNEGGVVINPYSGQECELNNLELSMYDFIKGAEAAISSSKEQPKKLTSLFYQGLWWFKDNSPEKYMILLD